MHLDTCPHVLVHALTLCGIKTVLALCTPYSIPAAASWSVYSTRDAVCGVRVQDKIQERDVIFSTSTCQNVHAHALPCHSKGDTLRLSGGFEGSASSRRSSERGFWVSSRSGSNLECNDVLSSHCEVSTLRLKGGLGGVGRESFVPLEKITTQELPGSEDGPLSMGERTLLTAMKRLSLKDR